MKAFSCQSLAKILVFCSVFCGVPHLLRIEPNWTQVTVTTVPLRPSPSRVIKALHLADLHYSGSPESLARIERAIALGLAENPDVILLTGDYIDRRIVNPDAYVPLLKRLSGAHPVFASLGNHDGGDWAVPGGGYSSGKEVKELLVQAGIRVLENESERLNVGGALIDIVGLADQWSGVMNAKRAFADRAGDELPTIVLSHNPDSKAELRKFKWDLLLAGHTHGGQVVIPFWNHAPFAPIGDIKYVSGLNKWGRRWIHTTRGVGTVMGARLNCRPEVALLRLEV